MRQPRELAELLLGERGAHRRDDRLEARLPQRDHVGVALDDARAVAARDRGARLVEAVEQRALVEELRLGRVDVLRAQRVVLVQPPRLEADDAAARVGEREDEPALEVVAAALARQAGGAQLVGGEPLLRRLARERVAAEREAEPELAADLLAEAAPGEVVARERAGLRVPEVALVERGRLVEQRVEPVAPAPSRVVGRARVLVLRLDVEAVGEPLDRAGEVEALRVADERDRVAARAAAEAVVEALHRVDREARRALLVERAAAGHAPADLAQRRAVLDDRDEVGRLLDGLDGRVLEACHQSSRAA